MIYETRPILYSKPRDVPEWDVRDVSTHAVPHAGYRPFSSAAYVNGVQRGRKWENKIARRRLSRRLAKVIYDRIVRDMEDDA